MLIFMQKTWLTLIYISASFNILPPSYNNLGSPQVSNQSHYGNEKVADPWDLYCSTTVDLTEEDDTLADYWNFFKAVLLDFELFQPEDICADSVEYNGILPPTGTIHGVTKTHVPKVDLLSPSDGPILYDAYRPTGNGLKSNNLTTAESRIELIYEPVDFISEIPVCIPANKSASGIYDSSIGRDVRPRVGRDVRPRVGLEFDDKMLSQSVARLDSDANNSTNYREIEKGICHREYGTHRPKNVNTVGLSNVGLYVRPIASKSDEVYHNTTECLNPLSLGIKAQCKHNFYLKPGVPKVGLSQIYDGEEKDHLNYINSTNSYVNLLTTGLIDSKPTFLPLYQQAAEVKSEITEDCVELKSNSNNTDNQGGYQGVYNFHWYEKSWMKVYDEEYYTEITYRPNEYNEVYDELEDRTLNEYSESKESSLEYENEVGESVDDTYAELDENEDDEYNSAEPEVYDEFEDSLDTENVDSEKNLLEYEDYVEERFDETYEDLDEEDDRDDSSAEGYDEFDISSVKEYTDDEKSSLEHEDGLEDDLDETYEEFDQEEDDEKYSAKIYEKLEDTGSSVKAYTDSEESSLEYEDDDQDDFDEAYEEHDEEENGDDYSAEEYDEFEDSSINDREESSLQYEIDAEQGFGEAYDEIDADDDDEELPEFEENYIIKHYQHEYNGRLQNVGSVKNVNINGLPNMESVYKLNTAADDSINNFNTAAGDHRVFSLEDIMAELMNMSSFLLDGQYFTLIDAIGIGFVSLIIVFVLVCWCKKTYDPYADEPYYPTNPGKKYPRFIKADFIHNEDTTLYDEKVYWLRELKYLEMQAADPEYDKDIGDHGRAVDYVLMKLSNVARKMRLEEEGEGEAQGNIESSAKQIDSDELLAIQLAKQFEEESKVAQIKSDEQLAMELFEEINSDLETSGDDLSIDESSGDLNVNNNCHHEHHKSNQINTDIIMDSPLKIFSDLPYLREEVPEFLPRRPNISYRRVLDDPESAYNKCLANLADEDVDEEMSRQMRAEYLEYIAETRDWELYVKEFFDVATGDVYTKEQTNGSKQALKTAAAVVGYSAEVYACHLADKPFPVPEVLQ